jgi:AraC-like DNA-binding protein
MPLDLNVIFHEDKPLWNEYVAKGLGEFPMFVKYREKYGRTSYHRQPGLEILVTNEGRGVLLVGENPILLSPKQMVVFRADIAHQLTFDPRLPYSRTVLCVDDAQIYHPDRAALTGLSWLMTEDCFSCTLTPAEYAKIDALLHSLHKEMNQKQRGWEQMAYAHMFNVTVSLYRAASVEQQKLQSAKTNELPELVQNCLNYILENLSSDLSLTHLATVFSVSPEHLTRVFRKEHGISLYQFVLLSRVSEAKRLLQVASHMTITDIALAVGFESSGQLSRTFRNFTKETPASYRKRVGKEHNIET